MHAEKYPHDREKYCKLLQHTKDSFVDGDPDSLNLLQAQANSLHAEGYLNKTEKRDISRLITALLEILAHPINH